MKSVVNKITYTFIKWYRGRYIPVYGVTNSYSIPDVETASKLLMQIMENALPCMVSRFGATEMDCYMNYRFSHPFAFLRSFFPFWIGENTKKRMATLSGFFPISNNNLVKFSRMTERSAKEIDILVSWLKQEAYIKCLASIPKIRHLHLEPYWSPEPWTQSLENKRVLVVHPFAKTIESQYEKREHLFEDKRVLPVFKSLTVIKAVQSLGGSCNQFESWFDALYFMENQIDNVEYDVALIGCGAYGMPLAAHCKSMGKKAVHMGGALQLLFGIRGGRWDDPNYNSEYDYTKLFNEYWVRPLEEERPPSADNVENACYW